MKEKHAESEEAKNAPEEMVVVCKGRMNLLFELCVKVNVMEKGRGRRHSV